MPQNQALGFPELFAWSSGVLRPRKTEKLLTKSFFVNKAGYYGYPYFYGPSFSFFFGFPAYYHYHGYYGGHYGYGYTPRPLPYRGGMIAYAYHGGAHH